jgi:hypothetical protein
MVLKTARIKGGPKSLVCATEQLPQKADEAAAAQRTGKECQKPNRHRPDRQSCVDGMPQLGARWALPPNDKPEVS